MEHKNIVDVEKYVPRIINTFARWVIFYPVVTIYSLTVISYLLKGKEGMADNFYSPLTWLVVGCSVNLAYISTVRAFKAESGDLIKGLVSIIRVLSMAVSLIFMLVALLCMFIRWQA